MLFDPTRRWVHRASCRTVDPERFFTPGSNDPKRLPVPSTQAKWNQAKKICDFCPVLELCKRDTLGEEFGVWGGLDEHQRWVARKRLTRQARQWPAEDRLAWGKVLHRLHEAGATWRRIRAMTGINEALAEQLGREWEAHLADRRSRSAQIVDLPLPEPEPLSFPPEPGRGHAWVRRAGLVSSALYRGETADGRFLFMTLMSGGRHQSHVWVPVDDVQLHTPQPTQIIERIGRPSRAKQPASRAQAG